MSAAREVRFNLAGCAVEYSCADPDLAAAVAADFSAFTSGGEGQPVRIEARLEPADPPERTLLNCRHYSVLPSRPGLRRVWYPEGALCEYDAKITDGPMKKPFGPLVPV